MPLVDSLATPGAALLSSPMTMAAPLQLLVALLAAAPWSSQGYRPPTEESNPAAFKRLVSGRAKSVCGSHARAARAGSKEGNNILDRP